jgi:hypothetical protein
MHIHKTDKWTTLLRTSLRDGKRIKKSTICNITSWSRAKQEQLKQTLKFYRRVKGTSLEPRITNQIVEIVGSKPSGSTPSAMWQLLTELDPRKRFPNTG